MTGKKSLTVAQKRRRDLAKRCLDASRVLFPNADAVAVQESSILMAKVFMGEDITAVDVARGLDVGADRSDHDRVFSVWMDKNVVGLDTIEEKVNVPAGADANAICGNWLDVMISNDIDSGWDEVRDV